MCFIIINVRMTLNIINLYQCDKKTAKSIFDRYFFNHLNLKSGMVLCTLSSNHTVLECFGSDFNGFDLTRELLLVSVGFVHTDEK